MEQTKYSPKFLKQGKFLMILPLLTVPFITIIFIALGGGKDGRTQTQGTDTTNGLNLKLPDAHFRQGKELDKLAMYEQANKDSLRIKQAIKNDPNYTNDSTAETETLSERTPDLQTILEKSASKYNQQGLAKTDKLKTSLTGNGENDPNEKKVMEKLAELKSALKRIPEPVLQDYSAHRNGVINPDTDKLQRLVSLMKQGKINESDPELDQINGMLDKIMNIQHPEKLQDSMKSLAMKNKPQSFTVHLINDQEADTARQNGFYELVEETISEASHSNAIEAIVEETQTLISGSIIKLRLLQDIYVHGMLVPKDQLIYGTASLSNERLKILINTVLSNDNILPVALDVYDMDGLQGIYVPGSINRDVSKQSADEAISAVGLTTFDPSLGAQAASAGIQAAKTLMSKKIKLVRVTIKSGYKVLLKDNNQK